MNERLALDLFAVLANDPTLEHARRCKENVSQIEGLPRIEPQRALIALVIARFDGSARAVRRASLRSARPLVLFAYPMPPTCESTRT
jgi:hypothetical protein